MAIAPLIAFAAFACLPARFMRVGVLGCAAIVLTILLASGVAHIELLSKAGDQALWATAMFGFAFLACTPSLIRQRWLRWPAITLSLAAVLLVWLLAMIGLFFGPDPVRSRVALPGGEVCEVAGWGLAVTDSGYRVSIYREWPQFGVRRQLAGETVNESQGDRDLSCEDLLARSRRGR